MEKDRTQLALEELSSRIAPSSLTFRSYGGAATTEISPIVAYSPPAHTGYRVFANRPLLPEGTATGSYVLTATNGTSGVTYNFTGTADLFGIGEMNFSGYVNTAGSTQSLANGGLLLTSSKGSIAMILSTPTSTAGGHLPGEMIFTVNGVSGEYLHVGGSGAVKFDTSPTSGSTGNFNISIA